MTTAFVRAEGGQALVVVGLAVAVILGALVLTVDWGYGLVMRRVAQNQADAAVLAAGRLLAVTYDGPGPSFSTTKEEVWNAACEARGANTTNSPAGVTQTLTVSFLDVNGVPLPLGAPFPSAPASTSAVCNLVANEDVPVGTFFVQVRSSSTYSSLFGLAQSFALVKRQSLVAGASARARIVGGASVRQLTLPDSTGSFSVGQPGEGLSGDSTAPNAAIWPIVRRYEPNDWIGMGGSFRLMGPGAPADTHFVSLAHFSLQEAEAVAARPQVHQLVTESDYTGAPTTHHGHAATVELVSSVPGCPSTMWNTSGRADPAIARTCDIPNWFYYGYRGSLSVGTDWGNSSWNDFGTYGDGQEPPSALPISRSSCNVLSTFPDWRAPSCDLSTSAPMRGDWVETVTGVDDRLVARQILSFINRYGRDVAGDKAVVVNLFLWDCGESFQPANSPDIRQNWDLRGSSGDCSRASSGPFHRVHLLRAVPVTVFASDVNTSSGQVDVRWGRVFGDAGRCGVMPVPSGCDPNPMINSAFLVPDD